MALEPGTIVDRIALLVLLVIVLVIAVRAVLRGAARRTRRPATAQRQTAEWAGPAPAPAPPPAPVSPAGEPHPAAAAEHTRVESTAKPVPAVVVHERRLVAPVELWVGDVRVGIVPGSETHRRFVRCANDLRADLDGASRRS